MVCSIWKHIAVRKNGDGLANHPEHKVKRACFKLGIGRELYTAPFIWVPNDKCNIVDERGKWTCRDTFSVAKVAIAEDEHGRRRISGIRIMNDKTKRVAFSWKED